MSDFLSNFDKDNYKKTLTNKKVKKEKGSAKKSPATKEPTKKRSATKASGSETVAEKINNELKNANLELEAERIALAEMQEDLQLFDAYEEPLVELVTPQAEEPLLEEVDTVDTAEAEQDTEAEQNPREEETELDPTYRKRKKKKITLISIASAVAAVLLFWFYYSMTHVTMPNFEGKSVSEAREWAATSKVKLDLEQKYDFKHDVNVITKQGVKKGKKVKKKSQLKLTASLGPDPAELLPMPDFSKLSKAEADEWVNEHKAENLSVLEEYSDKIEKNKFVRQEINNKEITPETYKREDQAIVYYSKGKEVFEKNIAVPDFAKKPKADVETWVKTNEIKMKYVEVDSDQIEEGLVVAQSVAKGTKIAKRTEMSIDISTGKAVVVPNFADLTPENASAVESMVVTVKTLFAADVPYGQLISQTLEAGTKVKAKEPKPVTVTYSAGRPYLRSYFGELEGDLAKSFYDDYRSKGANITYTTYYVDSVEERGRVVDMSAYNQFVALDYVVSIGISNGSKAGKPSKSGDEGTADSNDLKETFK